MERIAQDSDTFPYGSLTGTPLGDIPDDFWVVFLQTGAATEWPALVEYAESRLGSKRPVEHRNSEIGSTPKPTNADSAIVGDSDWMPLGRHKGRALGEIPNSYWRGFLTDAVSRQWPSIRLYAELCVSLADKKMDVNTFLNRVGDE